MLTLHNALWNIKNRVLFLEVKGKLDHRLLQALNEEMHRHLNYSESEKVHLLVDYSNMLGIDFALQNSIKDFAFFQHPKMGAVLGYGHKPPFEPFLNALAERAEAAMLHFPSLDAAVAHLERTEKKLAI